MSTNPVQNAAAGGEPLPLRARRDLRFQQMEFEGQAWVVVKDPLALAYYRIHVEQYRLLQLLDATRNIADIHNVLTTEYPASRTSIAELRVLITDLNRKGLIESIRSGQSDAALKAHSDRRRKKLLGAALNPFFIRLPGWDPEKMLSKLYPVTQWMFHRNAVTICSAFVMASWIHLAVHSESLQRQLPAFSEFFGWPNIALLWITLGLTKILHEVAHGLACRHFGGECHEIGVAFLVFSPCLYCDVSDSWMFPRKGKRIAVATAGIYIELLISAIALFLWWWTLPGMFHYLLLNIFLVTTFTTVIFNANPLLKYDGYYILADWMEIPNLRSKADYMLKRVMIRTCTGIDLPRDEFITEGQRPGLLIYAVAATFYRLTLIFVVGIFLYRLLTPFGLQSVAVFLSAGSVVFAVCSSGLGVARTMTKSGTESMSQTRVLTTATAAIALITGLLTIPISTHHHAPLIVQPQELRNVYCDAAGQVQQIVVQESESVTAGQPLMILENKSLRSDYIAAHNQLQQQQLQVAYFRAAGDSIGLGLAMKSVDTEKQALERIQERIDLLTVRAPCSGTVIAAPDTSDEHQSNKGHLPRRHGSLLEPRALGATVTAGTQICSVVPTFDHWQAVLFVDQSDRNDLHADETVEICLSHDPGRLLRGRVKQIGSREEESAPAVLTQSAGGTLPTVAGTGPGIERLASAIYQATVAIDNPTSALTTGMRGQGRFVAARQTAAGMIYIWWRRTFSF